MRRGFTLVELLVVVGIIVLLVGILLPTIMRSYRQADRTRTASDLNAIAVALDAYKADFGDYPRFLHNRNAPANELDASTERGARLLAKALVGPGPMVRLNPPTDDGADGADGPGFRTARGGLDDGSNGGTAGDGIPDGTDPAGKVWGPYLAPDRFKFSASDHTAKLLDRDGSAILYYPAAFKTAPKLDTASGEPYVATRDATAGTAAQRPMFNAWDNSGLAAEQKLRWFLGDLNANGRIDSGEQARFTGAYLLWTAGADGGYGPREGTKREIEQLDDVANF
jgi:prepilin-type N-terminal cleavage/methylation domain-containing protein